MANIVVNAVGEQCPIPVVKATKAIREMKEAGVIEVHVDNEIAVQNLTKLANSKNLKSSAEKKEEKLYVVTIAMDGAIEESGAQDECIACAPDKRGNTVVAIASERMGHGNDELGKVLMKGFIYALSQLEELPKTILYSLNPADNASIGTIIGCFQDSSAIGKIQQGSAWWFNDNKTGMQEQMTSFANLGLLGNFIGMLTDSRSFLSYTRHEYFRRILCELIGGWVENGEYPADYKTLEKIVKGISYNNAVRYFDFNL